MTAPATRPQSQPDDIDLLLLVERCILFFKRYRWLFIVAAIAGLVAGYLKYRSKPTIYSSRMILHAYALTNPEYIQIVKEWQALLKGNPAELADAFGSAPATLSKLKKIKADEIQKVFTPTNPNGFFVTVYVTDNSILPELQKGITEGFEKSEYVKARLDIRKAKFTELIEKTTTEIERLDSTKKELENIIAGKGSASSSLIIDGTTINRQLIEMNEKLLYFKEELKFSHAVEVLQGFSKYPQPIGPNLFVWLFLGLASCLSIAYIYALIDTISKRIKERRTK